jgi:hypothetical protein
MLPIAVVKSYHRGQEIYGPEDPADPAEQWYCVLSGLGTKSAMTADGRR